MQSQHQHSQERSRADLHVHSRYSDRPSEWLLRRIGSAECYTTPQEVYRRAKAAGMDFVTISDHNCIEGALEIAHLPDTFVSCEVTTYFPDDNAKFHLLVTGISEAQFAEIDCLRVDIRELRDYLVAEDIVHSLAHPLFVTLLLLHLGLQTIKRTSNNQRRSKTIVTDRAYADNREKAYQNSLIKQSFSFILFAFYTMLLCWAIYNEEAEYSAIVELSYRFESQSRLV